MASFKLRFLFILVGFLNFATAKAEDSVYLNQSCSTNRTTVNSAFQLDLRTLLSSLSSNDTGNTEFYNTTVAGRNLSDSVYGLFMCRGDVSYQLCHQCVRNATQRLSSECSLSKEAVIWYDECMVRYSSRPFFSTVDTRPRFSLWNTANISNQEIFMRVLFDTMNQTADKAANSPVGAKKYATKEANISAFQTLYCLAQCTDDLSPQDCRRCLSGVIGDLPWCCEGKQGGRVLYPSCNIRYELYPFNLSSTASAPTTTNSSGPATPPPPGPTAKAEDPVYLNQSCSTNRTTANSAFQLNLRTLLSSLSSNATGNTEFYNTTVAGRNPSDSVYGLFMCRGDVLSQLCHQCVRNATQRLPSECSLSKEAVIWYDQCTVRYSNRSFFSTVDTRPRYSLWNTGSLSNPDIFMRLVFDTMNQTADKAANSPVGAKKYDTKEANISGFLTLYCLAQCTDDLSPQDCRRCLSGVIGDLPWCCEGKQGGRVLYPSCNVRYELYPFYRSSTAPAPTTTNLSGPATPPGGRPTENREGSSRTIILIVVPTAVVGTLFIFGCYLLRRKTRKRNKTILKDNFGHESATLQPLQYDLATIEAATNNFSQENMIGKGGFGEVYKGILLDGRHVAVKRLSRSSKQGVIEFKNEILLISKLQHRNLVAFIGFCLEEQEKILIYEYVPNGSLDCLLFGIQQPKLLTWFERYKIIGGIVRGILYLHEHSRLKVIHRDLKPSNILLDQNMDPKISDFGLSRIVAIDQDEGSTNKIIGTYGYMSPEYAMFGQFSEKSDVFSFGVMVLEIITGKKNVSSYESHSAADSLLSYVWRQWKEGTPLSILDPNIKDYYSQIDVIKCIQIGLLCVQENPNARPTMAIILSYLSSDSLGLPSPQEPAFFLDGSMDSKILAMKSSSSQSANSFRPFSINEMSTSDFLPR